jgi:hypothetical protein
MFASIDNFDNPNTHTDFTAVLRRFPKLRRLDICVINTGSSLCTGEVTSIEELSVHEYPYDRFLEEDSEAGFRGRRALNMDILEYFLEHFPNVTRLTLCSSNLEMIHPSDNPFWSQSEAFGRIQLLQLEGPDIAGNDFNIEVFGLFSNITCLRLVHMNASDPDCIFEFHPSHPVGNAEAVISKWLKKVSVGGRPAYWPSLRDFEIVGIRICDTSIPSIISCLRARQEASRIAVACTLKLTVENCSVARFFTPTKSSKLPYAAKLTEKAAIKLFAV